VQVSRIAKIAGVTFVGFCAASIAADKGNLGPVASQLAGFVGAFVGSLVARKRVKPDEKEPGPPPAPNSGS
jgi:uncharacterized membrane protein YeaQ/YmgE (transglycosylase-associated protein family)